MLGILKAGAGYVPLDPEQPAARAGYIIGNCKMKGLVTDSLRLGRLDRETTGRLALQIVSGEPAEKELGNSVSWESLASYRSDRLLDLQPVTTDLAYILYTSCSAAK